jgi:hypothetical protein
LPPGALGHRYWQQKVDYNIKVQIDDQNRSLSGSETITYHNQSPDPLIYLWLQLDQNRFEQDSTAKLTQTAPTGNGHQNILGGHQPVAPPLCVDQDGG